jgi:hypothetical protein
MHAISAGLEDRAPGAALAMLAILLPSVIGIRDRSLMLLIVYALLSFATITTAAALWSRMRSYERMRTTCQADSAHRLRAWGGVRVHRRGVIVEAVSGITRRGRGSGIRGKAHQHDWVTREGSASGSDRPIVRSIELRLLGPVVSVEADDEPIGLRPGARRTEIRGSSSGTAIATAGCNGEERDNAQHETRTRMALLSRLVEHPYLSLRRLH